MNAPSCIEVWTGGTEPTSAVAGSGRCALFVRKSPAREPDSACQDVAGLVSWGDSASVLIVADGLGGHDDGDVAARLTVEAITGGLAETPNDATAIQSSILLGIQSANLELLDRAGGAATTILVASIQGDRFRSYHAGDSELLITGQRGRIKHQTVSHSPVGYAVESGLLDAAQGLEHEDRHLISSFVGMAGMRVEMASAIRLAPRDTVVLASDGLWDNMHVSEVTEIVRKGPLDVAARRVAETCARRMTGEAGSGLGKPDDLSVLIYRSG